MRRSAARLLCTSASLSSFNKNLKLRAILFSIDVLTGLDTTKGLAERKAALALKEEQQKAELAAAAAAAVKPIYDTSKEITNISTVKSKYMDKIRAKTGGSGPGERAS